MSAAATAASRKRKRTVRKRNRWPGECGRCQVRLEPGDGQYFEGPLRLICAACSLREGVRDDNGLRQRLARMASTPLKGPNGKELSLLPFQVKDCERIATTRALLIGNQMGCGKCLSDSDLAQINGQLIEAEEVWSRYASDEGAFDGEGWWADPVEPLFVNAIDDATGEIVRCSVRRLYRQQVSEKVRRVRLRDGSETTITQAHKLRGPSEWTNQLRPGDRACVPSRLLHEDGVLDLELAELFGWMVGDGHEYRGGSRPNTMVVTQKLAKDLNRIRSLAQLVSDRYGLDLNVRVSDHDGLGRASDVCISSSGFRAFCESHDYPWGTLSKDRRVPSPIMQGNADVVRAFLRSYLDADGSVPKGLRYVEYSSASERLAKEVSTLLRRFGVWVTIRKKRARATNSPKCPYRDYWVGSFGGPSARRFLETVGFSVDYKQEELVRLCAHKANSNTEGVPASGLIAGIVKRTGLPASWFGLDPKHRFSTVYLKGTQEFSRGTLAVVVQCMDKILSGQRGEEYLAGKYRRKAIDKALASLDWDDLRSVRDQAQRLIDQEVHYPEIEEIEEFDYEGWVYDFEIEEHHNYVAEGILCHNTIEAAVAAIRDDRPNLVFCPASVRENWIKEIETWRPELKGRVGFIESQNAFRQEIETHLSSPGHVLVGSFGVLPGSPCKGCRALKAKLRALKKWKVKYCLHCDERRTSSNPCSGCGTLKALKRAGRPDKGERQSWVEFCVKCEGDDLTIKGEEGACTVCGVHAIDQSRPRYHGELHGAGCMHIPPEEDDELLEGDYADVMQALAHPPYIDLKIDGVTRRLPYHASGDLETWIESGIVIPDRKELPPEILPDLLCKKCRGLEPDERPVRCSACRCRGCCQTNPQPEIDTSIVLIADECHAFKNPSSQRTKNWRGLRRRVWEAEGYVYGLSGTPCEGKPLEFWEVLTSMGLAEGAFGSFSKTYKRIFAHWFSHAKGERLPPQGSLRDELHERLKRVQINRRRKDVLSQLPPRTEVVIPVDISDATVHEVNEAVHRMLAVKRSWEDVLAGARHNGTPLLDPFSPHITPDERDRRRLIYESRVEYYFVERPWNKDEEIVEAVDQALMSKGRMPTIDQLSRIRAMLSQAKIAAVKQWIEDREQEDEPVVLFSQHVQVLKKASQRPGWECFHGGLTPKQRSAMVKRYQSGETSRGLAVSIGAGGEGITLTRAAVCAFIDLSWNPAKNAQAESRLIRIGAEQHYDRATEQAWERIRSEQFGSCAEEPCRIEIEEVEGTRRQVAVPCLEHQARITVVRFVAKHVVDQLVIETLKEKEALLASLEWSEDECE